MSCPFHGQRTFFYHSCTWFFWLLSVVFNFFSLFWAGSLFCLPDIVPTVVLLWPFILPVTTTLCIQQYFLWCAQIKTWSFSDIEKTFPCHQYFLSASGVWARYWQFTLSFRHDNFFSGICFDNFSCESVSKNFLFPRTRFNLNFQRGEHNWLVSFSLPTNADRLHLCKLIDSDQKYLICYVLCYEDNSCWES